MRLTPLLSLVLPIVLASAVEAQDWPHWRGPNVNGVAACDAPVVFGDEENLRWKVELPGRGMSSPIVVGRKAFVTTAIPIGEAPDEESAPQEEQDGRRGRRGGPRAPLVEQAFEVLCFDRVSGDQLWRTRVATATPHEAYHPRYGSWASASPVVEDERLYVSFGSFGIFALDLDGEKLWEAELGVALEMRNQFGEGTAPVIAGDVLVLVNDHEGDSFVLALDKKTGTELWRKSRDEPSAWSTPLVTTQDGKLQVVTAGTNRVRSYSPKTGEILWECGGLGLNAIPAVSRTEDLVLCMSGYRNPRILAIELGGKGDLTETDAVAWSSTRGCAYTASPVLADGLYYSVSDRGQISCFDASTGEAHYLEERLPRGSALKASPVAAGEFLYVSTEDGDVHLVALGPELDVARTNHFAEQTFIASPAVAHGDLYLRSLTHLFCVSDEADG